MAACANFMRLCLLWVVFDELALGEATVCDCHRHPRSFNAVIDNEILEDFSLYRVASSMNQHETTSHSTDVSVTLINVGIFCVKFTPRLSHRIEA